MEGSRCAQPCRIRADLGRLGIGDRHEAHADGRVLAGPDTALAEGGPGTSASAADLAGYVRDYDPEGAEDADGPDGGPPGAGADGPDGGPPGAGADEDDDGPDDFFFSEDDEFDDLTLEGLFLPVTSLWQVLGAIDENERLTPLGWWGLPEAMLRVWAPSGGGTAG